jgi:hypothetical protein
MELNHPTAKPVVSPHQRANSGPMPLIGNVLGVSQPIGIVDGQMGIVKGRTSREPMAPIDKDPGANAIEPSKLFGDDVDHVAKLLPLVPPHVYWWMQMFRASKPMAVRIGPTV